MRPKPGTRVCRGGRFVALCLPLLAGTTLACTTLACGSPGPGGMADPDGGWRGTITSDGDVTTVINESGSVWGAPASLVEELAIGVEVGEPEYMLGAVRAVAAGRDRIYVLEERPPRVREYDLEGVHLTSFGVEGQGPGELNRPMSLTLTSDGRLVVRDDGNGRLYFFSPSGELLESWPMAGRFMSGQPLVIDAAGVVYSPGIRVGDDPLDVTRGMVPHGPEGAGELIPFPDLDYEPPTIGELSFALPGGARIRSSATMPFAPRAVEAMSPAGAFIVGIGDRYRFEVRSFDGPTLIVERRADPVPIGSDEAAWQRRYTTAVNRSMMPDWSWDGPDVPNHKPYFERLHPDHSGRIWVGRKGPSTHVEDCDESPPPARATEITRCWIDTYIFEVFEPEGRYLGEVQTPRGFDLGDLGTAFIRDDMLVVPLEDELGTIMIRRYRIVTTEGSSR